MPLGAPNTVSRQDTYVRLSDGRQTNRLDQRTCNKTIGGTTSQVWQGTYSYDMVGNVTQFQDSSPQLHTSTYSYDQAYRLTSAYGASGNAAHPNSYYRYDAAGNRTTWGNEVVSGVVYDYDSRGQGQITQTTDDANRMVAFDDVGGTFTINRKYQYEDNGNLRAEVGTYTGISDPCATTGMSRSVFTYHDDAGRLVTRHQVGSEQLTNRDNRTTYTYNGDGRRLTQLYQQTDAELIAGKCTQKPAWSEFTAYEYANGKVLNERTGGDVPVWYIRDPKGQLLYTLHWRAGELKPDVFLFDRLGSIRMIVDYQGSIANQQQYDAYGSATESTSTLRNSYAYTAYGLDQPTGLYYAKARYYQSDLGRFMTQDTYQGSAWQPWTQNLYAYVGNNPINYIDPTGHCAKKLWVVAPMPEAGIEGTWRCDDPPPLVIDRSQAGIVKITARINFVGGTNEQQAAIKEGILGAWNRSDIEGVKVVTALGMQTEEDDAIDIYVTKDLPWDAKLMCGDERSCVPWASTSNASPMYIYSDGLDTTGLSSRGSFQYTAAHEFGHVLGLRDRYQEHAVNQPAMPGYAGNLMAFDGLGLKKSDVDAITTNHRTRLMHFI